MFVFSSFLCMYMSLVYMDDIDLNKTLYYDLVINIVILEVDVEFYLFAIL